MKKSILIILLSCFSCIEKYDFNVKKGNNGLVIESFISNKSFTETILIPSDGRYFSVLLRLSSDVDNVRDKKMPDALVFLVDNNGNKWLYDADVKNGGYYYLRNPNFKAQKGIKYQLNVVLKQGQHFESDWEVLPALDNEIGAVTFKEKEKEAYEYEQDERVIKNITGIDVSIDVPSAQNTDKRFLIWSFDPFWTYTAALTDVNSAVRKCWVEGHFYLRDIVIQKDRGSNFQKKLFFMKTKTNERIYDYFSVVINQRSVSEGYYTFWEDLKAQEDKGGLYDKPPFGLITNFKATNSEWGVNGYFGVVSENIIRWQFKKEYLSYIIKDDLEYYCTLYYEPDPEGLDACIDCRNYQGGTSTNKAPNWWK